MGGRRVASLTGPAWCRHLRGTPGLTMRGAHMKRRLVVMVLVAAVVVVSTPLASVSAGGNVAPPGSRSHGLSYAERAAAWWRWAIALPASGHPLVSEGNVDCSVGQSGHVWYLAGAFAPAPPARATERTCDIPSGTALFLPLVNVDCSTLEADPFFGANEAELRACVRRFGFTDLHASVDGVESPISTASWSSHRCSAWCHQLEETSSTFPAGPRETSWPAECTSCCDRYRLAPTRLRSEAPSRWAKMRSCSTSPIT